MNTHPWGSATVTSYAPGVHPFPTVFPMCPDDGHLAGHREDINQKET